MNAITLTDTEVDELMNSSLMAGEAGRPCHAEPQLVSTWTAADQSPAAPSSTPPAEVPGIGAAVDRNADGVDVAGEIGSSNADNREEPAAVPCSTELSHGSLPAADEPHESANLCSLEVGAPLSSHTDGSDVDIIPLLEESDCDQPSPIATSAALGLADHIVAAMDGDVAAALESPLAVAEDSDRHPLDRVAAHQHNVGRASAAGCAPFHELHGPSGGISDSGTWIDSNRRVELGASRDALHSGFCNDDLGSVCSQFSTASEPLPMDSIINPEAIAAAETAQSCQHTGGLPPLSAAPESAALFRTRSIYRGVVPDDSGRRWLVFFDEKVSGADGRKGFRSEVAAAIARDQAVIESGARLPLNFPTPSSQYVAKTCASCSTASSDGSLDLIGVYALLGETWIPASQVADQFREGHENGIWHVAYRTVGGKDVVLGPFDEEGIAAAAFDGVCTLFGLSPLNQSSRDAQRKALGRYDTDCLVGRRGQQSLYQGVHRTRPYLNSWRIDLALAAHDFRDDQSTCGVAVHPRTQLSDAEYVNEVRAVAAFDATRMFCGLDPIHTPHSSRSILFDAQLWSCDATFARRLRRVAAVANYVAYRARTQDPGFRWTHLSHPSAGASLRTGSSKTRVPRKRSRPSRRAVEPTESGLQSDASSDCDSCCGQRSRVARTEQSRVQPEHVDGNTSRSGCKLQASHIVRPARTSVAAAAGKDSEQNSTSRPSREHRVVSLVPVVSGVGARSLGRDHCPVFAARNLRRARRRQKRPVARGDADLDRMGSYTGIRGENDDDGTSIGEEARVARSIVRNSPSTVVDLMLEALDSIEDDTTPASSRIGGSSVSKAVAPGSVPRQDGSQARQAGDPSLRAPIAATKVVTTGPSSSSTPATISTQQVRKLGTMRASEVGGSGSSELQKSREASQKGRDASNIAIVASPALCPGSAGASKVAARSKCARRGKRIGPLQLERTVRVHRDKKRNRWRIVASLCLLTQDARDGGKRKSLFRGTFRAREHAYAAADSLCVELGLPPEHGTSIELQREARRSRSEGKHSKHVSRFVGVHCPTARLGDTPTGPFEVHWCYLPPYRDSSSLEPVKIGMFEDESIAAAVYDAVRSRLGLPPQNSSTARERSAALERLEKMLHDVPEHSVHPALLNAVAEQRQQAGAGNSERRGGPVRARQVDGE